MLVVVHDYVLIETLRQVIPEKLSPNCESRSTLKCPNGEKRVKLRSCQGYVQSLNKIVLKVH